MFGRDFWGDLERNQIATRQALELPGESERDAAVEAWLPVATREIRGVIVHLHGGGNDARQGPWRLVEASLKAGFGCVLFHQTGHGAGGSSRYSRDSALERALAVFEAVKRAFPGVPLSAVGQSLGGAVLLDSLLGFAERSLSPLASAVVVSPPHTLRVLPESWLEARVLLQPLAWRLAWEMGLEEVFPATGPFRRERFPVRVDREKYPRDERDYVWPIERSVDEMHILDRIESLGEKSKLLPPILILHGVRDRLIRVEQGREIAQAFQAQGASVRYEEDPKAGHFDILIGRATNERMIRWIARG
jgi:pimeloyl-ACP methyl ester carboxylesterase